MKKTNFKQFLVAIATIIFFSTSISSCKKDDNNGGGSTTITTNAAIKLDSINLAYGSFQYGTTLHNNTLQQYAFCHSEY